jgi:single-strand DNA-binding protein
MTATRGSTGCVAADPAGAHAHVNEVRLVGRVSGQPEERQLPSGDSLVSFRVVVGRGPVADAAERSRARVDTLDCVAWAARVRRTVTSWQPGDVVEIDGAVRRRFRRTPAGPTSRVEIEVLRGRRRRGGRAATSVD